MGFYSYWAARSHEAAGDYEQAKRWYFKIILQYHQEKDDSTQVFYRTWALDRFLELSSSQGKYRDAQRMIRDYDSWLDSDRIIWFDETGRETANAPAEPLSRYRLATAFAEAGKKLDALDSLHAGPAPEEGTFLKQGQTTELRRAWEELLSELP